MLLSTAFFPPVSWFAAAAKDWGRVVVTNPSSFCDVYLEAHENFQKQSYRNRCIIASANGPEAISVPVVHDGDIFHTPITEIRVDYKDQWVKKAWRAIESAYSTSAYFEYYKDDIYAILSSGIPTLWDLNLRIIEFFIQKIRLGIRIVPTESYASAGNALDYRNVIHPKRQNTILKDLDMEKPYFQVFAGKYGFQSDLSVMDLLFNEGPQSLLYLVPSLD
ncbi:MAG: WbqC family protein [Bacteroidales bacterium]|nr:WbqC family protein [Bacteroidales bacterium]